ncbi:MAG: phytanoyl-CoA dioxygenase family protein [Planctomycetota bacterium]
MLTSSQLTQYHADGFLLVRDLFRSADLQPVIDEISSKVDRLAQRLQADGKLSNLHTDAGFYQRLTLIERDCPGASVMLHTQGVLEPAMAHLWSHPRLLAIMVQLLGPNVVGHPVWNLRCKTPDNPLATVPWHQDTAYLAPGSETTFQPTAWIPFLDATGAEGTLQFVRGSHRAGKVFSHGLERSKGGANANSWYLEVPEDRLPTGEIVRVDVPFGSVLLLNQLILHRSTENRSERIRWSVDLRYQRPGEKTGMEVAAPPVEFVCGGARIDPIDWQHYLGHTRSEKIHALPVDRPDLVAASIHGPWMQRWSTVAAAAR